MKCWYEFVKYTLLIVNAVFLIVAIAAIVLGTWMLTDKTFLVSIAQEQHDYNAGLYILLAAGILMFVVAVLGCCGAFRESRCNLISSFCCLLVVIVGQIALGAWLYANRHRLEELLKSNVINTIKNEYGEIECRTRIVDTFQSELECCGATGPADWAGSKYASKDPSLPISLTVSSDNSNMYKVPESCCKIKDSNVCNEARDMKIAGVVSDIIYSEGCTNKLVNALMSQTTVVAAIVIGIGILELIGVIFALILCRAIGSSDRYKA